MNASTQPRAGAESRFNTAMATPPSINALAMINLKDIRSERNATPPREARTGTRSCATAAWVVVKPLSALYQRTYPSPDVMTPDINASATPDGARWAEESATALAMSAIGADRKKFPAVMETGAETPLPRIEYTPQAIPAKHISSAPIGSGAESPGSAR